MMPNSILDKIHVTYVDPKTLKPYANNAKIHTDKQIQEIANSIEQFRFINPIIVDGSGEIIAGHGRLQAALKIGMLNVPVVEAKHLSKEQIKAYRIVDNKLTMNTGFDNDLLKIDLAEIEFESELDMTCLGFQTAELDNLFSDIQATENEEDLIPVSDRSKPSVTQLGDLIILGKHRLICGNSLEEEFYTKLMGSVLAEAIICDPPYNVKVDGHVCGAGNIKHPEFAMASGEMSAEQFTAFLAGFIQLVIQFSLNGSLHYIFMDWRHIFELISAGR